MGESRSAPPSGRVASAAKARHCFAFCLYSSILRIVLDLGHPRTGMANSFRARDLFRYSDAAPKELRASTSSDGDDDDGGTGNRRSNAGDGSDDGSSHSDDGSTDDDSRTKMRLDSARHQASDVKVANASIVVVGVLL